jgi:excisionase family DNA binding protein
MIMPTVKAPSTKVTLLLTIPQAAQALNVGRSVLYELLLAGDIASIKIGRSRRIVFASLQDYVMRQARDVALMDGGQPNGQAWE